MNRYGSLEQFKCTGNETDDEQTEGKVDDAFEFISLLKCMKTFSRDSMEWTLQSIEDITSTRSVESSKIMWSLLKKLAVLDESDADLFISHYQ